MDHDFELYFIKATGFGHTDTFSTFITKEGGRPSDEDFVITITTVDPNVQCICEDSVETLPLVGAVIRRDRSKNSLLHDVYWITP